MCIFCGGEVVQTNKYGRTVTLVTREIKDSADRRWISAEGQRGHLSRIFSCVLCNLGSRLVKGTQRDDRETQTTHEPQPMNHAAN